MTPETRQRHRLRRRASVWVVAGCLLLPACTASPTPAKTGPRAELAASAVREVQCAQDISGTVLGDVQCLMVAVPLHRDSSAVDAEASRDGGETIEVHVTRLAPPSGIASRSPVLVVPAVAATPNYLGLAPMAQRTERELIIVDGRGAGHSDPALTCPELTAHATWELSQAPAPHEARARYLRAVGQCADRLRIDGVDPTAFSVAETAADLVDVRQALGINRWAVTAIGSAARFVPALMAEDGDAVEAVLLDSPEQPGLDPVAAATELTAHVIHQLLTACAKDLRCDQAHPAARRLWAAAKAAVVRKDLRLPAGSLGTVPVDSALLLRLVRATITDGGSSGDSFTPTSLPAVLEGIAAGGSDLLSEEVGPLLDAQDPFCLGYHTDCLKRMSLAAGTHLSILCPTVMPTDTATERRHQPAAAEVFSRRLDPQACRRFGTAIDAPPPDPYNWSAPTLVFAGRYAPATPLPTVRNLVHQLPAASLIIDPAGADNVMPRTECTLGLRRAWLDNPQATVAAPPCLSRLRIEWYLGHR